MMNCVYINPTNIPSVWKDIKPDVIRCINKGGLELHTHELVYEYLSKGEWTLWLAYAEEYPGRMLGFTILEVVAARNITIVYAYVKPWIESKISRQLLHTMIHHAEGLGKAFKVKKVLAYSARKGMSTIMVDELGYKADMRIYVKELEYENETPEEDSRH